MSVLVTQDVLEVVVSPTTAAVRSSQEVLEVIINSNEAENPQVLPLSVSTSSLPNGTVGTAYSQALSATGGTAPYTWAVTVGTLPAGLSLSGSTIAGTPSAAGTSTFTVRATDTAARTATQSLSITVIDPVTISTVSLPNGTVDSTYSQSLAASGGTAPYTWAVTVGTLPDGLTLSGSTIAGTPATAGTSTFTVQATDSAAQTATQSLTIVVEQGGFTGMRADVLMFLMHRGRR